LKTQLSDITAIANFGDLLILLIKNADVQNEGCKCCQLNLENGKYVFFEDINLPLKFTPYEEIPEFQRESYRVEIYRRVKDSIIVEILQSFEENFPSNT